MKEIYTITTLNITEEAERLDGINFKEYRDRCVGFFFSLNAAKLCVLNDYGDLNEAGYYNYLVIERLSEGLYPGCGRSDEEQSEWWFKRDYELNKWVPCLKPKSMMGVISFGIG